MTTRLWIAEAAINECQPHEVTVVHDTEAAPASVSECIQAPAKLKLASLDYVDVTVKGIPSAVSALIDSGSQLSVIIKGCHC